MHLYIPTVYVQNEGCCLPAKKIVTIKQRTKNSSIIGISNNIIKVYRVAGLNGDKWQLLGE